MKPERRSKICLAVKRYIFSVLITGILLAIIIIQIKSFKAQREWMSALEVTMKEQNVQQTELLFATVSQEIAGMKEELAEQIGASAQTIIERLQVRDSLIQQIGTGAQETGERLQVRENRVQQIEIVSSSLIDGQTKRTLDSLYTETLLIEIEQEAAQFFRDGNYVRASAGYELIARERPENMEARFYRWYSLFLSNKLDRGNYKQIKEGLQGLEMNGYHRDEIREVLEYIQTEEAGLSDRAEIIQ
jgi:hypothetical protein